MSSSSAEVAPKANDPSVRHKPRKLVPKPESKASVIPARVRRSQIARIPNRKVVIKPRGCAVCGRFGCQLRSHQMFSATVRTTSTDSSTNGLKQNDAVYDKSYAYFYAQQYIDVDLAAGKVDPFYELPIGEQKPELHKLFHNYFVQLKEAFRFPLPAGIPGDLVGGPLLVPAMNDTAVCLSVLATAASWPTVRAGLPTSVQALTLHTQAIQRLRERLYPAPTQITDSTLLAAILIWAMELLQSSLESISANARSVYSLVLLRGGLLALYHMPAILQLIIWLDALTGQILEEEMRFNEVVQEPDTSNLDLPKHKYGELLEQNQVQNRSPTKKNMKLSKPIHNEELTSFSMSSVDPELSRILLNMCRATELLEDALENGITYVRFQHAMTLLNFIIARMAVIHARYKGTRTWDRCICIALNIYYLVTFHPGQDMRPFPLRLCARLRVALDRARSSDVPLANEILLWIACVVAVVPHHFEDREYFMDLLSVAITAKFKGSERPQGWEMEVQQSLRSLVWSDERHTAPFDDVCREIRKRTVPIDD